MLKVENLKFEVIHDPSEIQVGNNQVIFGDTMDIIKKLPNCSYASCITSPPYWGVRDYDEENQIGSEESLDEYINKIVQIFRYVRDKLMDNGTLWLNLGDSYTSGNRKRRAPDKKNQGRAMEFRPPTPRGLKPKDLIGLPWRIAFALQEDGWYLRSDIIWNKPNGQPESVKDRPTRSHEYVFLLTKSKNYYYNYRKLTEPSKLNGEPRNIRTVWNVNTENYSGTHFATFPQKLILPMIEGSSKEGDIILDPFFGAGTLGLACIKTYRFFHGIELNQDYVELAQNRINEYINGRLF